MAEHSSDQSLPTPELASAIARQEATLQLQLDWIRAVDCKTPVVIGVATAMLAVTGALSPAPANITWVTGVLIIAAILPVLVCIGWCIASTFPQTTGPRGSMIFFGGIAAMAASEYSKAIGGRSDAEYLEDLNAQCHRNAEIAADKYKAVRHAMAWLFVSLLPWVATCSVLYKG